MKEITLLIGENHGKSWNCVFEFLGEPCIGATSRGKKLKAYYYSEKKPLFRYRGYFNSKEIGSILF